MSPQSGIAEHSTGIHVDEACTMMLDRDILSPLFAEMDMTAVYFGKSKTLKSLDFKPLQ